MDYILNCNINYPQTLESVVVTLYHLFFIYFSLHETQNPFQTLNYPLILYILPKTPTLYNNAFTYYPILHITAWHINVSSSKIERPSNDAVVISSSSFNPTLNSRPPPSNFGGERPCANNPCGSNARCAEKGGRAVGFTSLR